VEVAADTLADVLQRARVLVFDFDGTLVDSNDIKWRGFETVFRDFPDHLPRIRAYCRGANHTVRREKFRHVYEHIVGLPYSPDVDRRLHADFAKATTAAIVAAPEIPGARAFLRRVHGRALVAILSSTPHDVLLEVLDMRGWSGDCDVVRGAPVDKAAWISAFLVERQLESDQLMFFGDTPEDAAAGANAGCAFVHVGWTPSPLGGFRVPDLMALAAAEEEA
jgi:phosphoglycolate phosphatase-like HAD superfamily hydrolase